MNNFEKREKLKEEFVDLTNYYSGKILINNTLKLIDKWFPIAKKVENDNI